MNHLEIIKLLYLKNEMWFKTKNHGGIVLASKFGTVYTVADADNSYYLVVHPSWDFYSVVRYIEEWGIEVDPVPSINQGGGFF